MTLKYTLSPQDYLEYMQYVPRSDPSYKTRVNAYRVMFLLPVLAIALMLAYLLRFSSTATLIALIIAILLCVLWVFLAPKRMQAAQKNTAQKQLQSGKTGLFFAQRTLTLQPDGVHLISKTPSTAQTSLFGYVSITRIGRDAGRLYIYIEEALVIVVPLTAFANAEQHAAFEQMLQQYSGRPIIATKQIKAKS